MQIATQPSTLIHHFRQHAARQPEARAIDDDDFQFTYGELLDRVNQLANYLHAAGINQGDMIAIYAQRCAGLVGAILGVWQAGASCLLIDANDVTAQTVETLRQLRPMGWIVLEEASTPPALVQWVVDNQSPLCSLRYAIDETLPAAQSHAPNIAPVACDQAVVLPAQMLEDEPVLLSHQLLVDCINELREQFRLSRDDRFCLLSPLSNGRWICEITLPLFLGASLAIPSQLSAENPKLARWLIDHHITVCHLDALQADTLQQAHRILSTPNQQLHNLFLDANGLSAELILQLRRWLPWASLHSLYHLDTLPFPITSYQLPHRGLLLEQDAIPLGFSAAASIFILDEKMEPHSHGSIWVKAPQHVASGFAHPHLGRLLPTGDFGRVRADGMIELINK